MRLQRSFIAVIVLAASLAAKKKNPDDFTQTLALPKDPPAVAVGETKRLVFHVSPLSGKGLLSQQTREALKVILKENGGASVVHIRAFVAGSGDVRRVPQIVSEVFTEKKLPIPSVSVVLCGGLPVENAQVVLEAISIAKKDVNPAGLEFFGGEEKLSDGSPVLPIRALLEKSLAFLADKMPAANALQVSCFVTDLTDALHLTSDIVGRFPAAAVDLVQTERAPFRAMARCEGVARGGSVQAAQIAFSGTRVAFGSNEKDASAAFQRLDRDLTEAGATPADIVFTSIYSLSPAASDAARKLRPQAPPMAVIPFEGVASIDAGFAVDAVAIVSR
jgi:enamine deaminase RidA (YjgF/YER057c/UK114 family)